MYPLKSRRIHTLTVITEQVLSLHSVRPALTLATQIKFHGPINFPRRFRLWSRRAPLHSSREPRKNERQRSRRQPPSLLPTAAAHCRIWSYINEKAINKVRPKIEFVERTKREGREEGEGGREGVHNISIMTCGAGDNARAHARARQPPRDYRSPFCAH